MIENSDFILNQSFIFLICILLQGHDTVSSAVSFCLMMIANHPEIQVRTTNMLNIINIESKSKFLYTAGKPCYSK